MLHSGQFCETEAHLISDLCPTGPGSRNTCSSAADVLVAKHRREGRGFCPAPGDHRAACARKTTGSCSRNRPGLSQARCVSAIQTGSTARIPTARDLSRSYGGSRCTIGLRLMREGAARREGTAASCSSVQSVPRSSRQASIMSDASQAGLARSRQRSVPRWGLPNSESCRKLPSEFVRLLNTGIFLCDGNCDGVDTV